VKKNIAVIGCGHWGKNLVRNFNDLGRLSAICDPDSSIAKKYADQYSVDDLPFKEILKNPKINGVVLAVPAHLHAPMAIQAMEACKNVYVEKPLAMTQSEAISMIDCSKKMDVKLMVGHLLQYHPIFTATKHLCNSGELGKIQYVYSNRLSCGKIRTEEDVIWSFAPHDISMILSLIDEKLKYVRAESANITQKKIADKATIYMEFISGLKTHISVSWLNPVKEQKLVVIGDSATLIFDDTKSWKEKLVIYRHQFGKGKIKNEIVKGEAEYITIPESEPLSNECKHFVDVVDGKLLPKTDGAEGLNVLKVLTAASSSIKIDSRVEMESNGK